MVQKQLLHAAQKMAQAGMGPTPPGADNIAGGMSQYGLGAIIAAVESDCACKACQLLRQVANQLTMTLLKQAGEVVATPDSPPDAPPQTPSEGSVEGAPGHHSPPGTGSGS